MEDEWNFKKVLKQHNIEDDSLLLSLNDHMDKWAIEYNIGYTKAKRATAVQILCYALQLSINEHRSGSHNQALEDMIEMLQKLTDEEKR